MKWYYLPLSLLLILLVAFVGYQAFSLFMYQRLVNEATVISDKQCFTVNPLIIKRKESYIRSMEAIKAKNDEVYKKETEDYFKISGEFITAQKAWLSTQKAFMDRWDFQHFLPSYVKDAAHYQYASRKADMESTALLAEAFEVSTLNASLAEEIGQKSMEKIKARNEADKKYDELWDNPGKLDWRTRFIKVPESKCPAENFDIPDTDLNTIFNAPPAVSADHGV